MTHLKTYILLLLITCTSCGQEITKQTTMHIPDRTIQDFLDIYKTVEHYEIETRHWVKITVANCNFEVLINDEKMHFYHDIRYGGVINATYAPINPAIVKAGKQTLKIRMFPGLDEKIKGPKPILDNAQIKVSIVADDFIEGESTGEYTIFSWESPTEKKFIKKYNKEIPYFTKPDLQYYEHTAVFEVEVPYTIEKWGSSQVLYTENAEQLKKLTEEVMAAYIEMKDIFQRKDEERLAAVSYNKEKIIAQQLFFTKKKSHERWENDYLINFNSNERRDLEMQPIENFKIVFYGNGRLVALERVDLQFRGESALMSYYKNEKGERVSHYNFILHRPKKGGKLESI